MNKYLKFSAAGLIALALAEGYVGGAYRDVAGIWTNGFGNTHNVDPGRTVNVPDALNQLGENIKDAERAVHRCTAVPLNQNQYDAFVSFTFNVGAKAFCDSTLVKKLNAGDYTAACDQLLRWDYAGGKRVRGLTRRRQEERAQCLS
ncbi:lysozyme [Pseudomethylobacillus aquaticus]|uniref:Lysozyme n=1 Tax=Pseudomethylobacillus aquaticus TaxID=2676064 RepID=A0A3N0V5X1_9PROT|nr:lysozyme [Pseudomethylobacillus aquaticus]ROH87992.1 lysozyme [Pseudomethylobacillus aquaticus]